jgi:hypothetical protein
MGPRLALAPPTSHLGRGAPATLPAEPNVPEPVRCVCRGPSAVPRRRAAGLPSRWDRGPRHDGVTAVRRSGQEHHDTGPRRPRHPMDDAQPIGSISLAGTAPDRRQRALQVVGSCCVPASPGLLIAPGASPPRPSNARQASAPRHGLRDPGRLRRHPRWPSRRMGVGEGATLDPRRWVCLTRLEAIVRGPGQ